MSTSAVRVLVADDDFLVTEMVAGMLADLGFECVGRAADGHAAVEQACALRPDVVLMDIEMPGLGGVEATRQLNVRCPTAVVMLTAFESKELTVATAAAGAGAYLLKPPQKLELERAILIAQARFQDTQRLRELSEELAETNARLQSALATVKTLAGLIPICAGCKDVRSDAGYWQKVEVFVRDHSDADFTHSICPTCYEKLYGSLDS